MVRAYAPERADGIDFSTLEKLDAEQVGEALVRRYPDMLWTAWTRDGGARVMILLEFQGTGGEYDGAGIDGIPTEP